MADLETKTIRTLVAASKPWLEKRGVDGARTDAELLIAHALGVKRIDLFLDLDRPLSDDEVVRCRALIARRGAREPVSQILEQREFFGLPFRVSADVLTPRPETELLVEVALRAVGDDVEGLFVDACTGSGCVAIALLSERLGLRAVATDISEKALAIASHNANTNDVADRFDARAGDLLAPVPEGERALFVVANPPYIREDERASLMPEVRDHEPGIALFGEEPDGLGHHRRILAQAHAIVVDDALGFVALEIGAGQGDACRSLAAPGFQPAVVERDLAGLDRVAIWRRA